MGTLSPKTLYMGAYTTPFSCKYKGMSHRLAFGVHKATKMLVVQYMCMGRWQKGATHKKKARKNMHVVDSSAFIVVCVMKRSKNCSTVQSNDHLQMIQSTLGSDMYIHVHVL